MIIIFRRTTFNSSQIIIVPGFTLPTELASLDISDLPGNSLQIGYQLGFELETPNVHASETVIVLNGDGKMRYIKKIHCRTFHKPGSARLKLSIKVLDKNGKMRKVF